MKLIFYLIIASLIFQITTYSQDGWFWQNPLPQGNDLSSITFISPTTGWAVGIKGTMIKTTDFGESWEIIPTGTNEWLMDIEFFDEENGIAVGNGGIILKTTDSGVTWTRQMVGNKMLKSVSKINEHTAIVVGYSGTILKTTDYGNNWTTQISNTTIDLRDVFFIDLNIGYVVGQTVPSGGRILLKTTNGGVDWIGDTSVGGFSLFYMNEITGIVLGFFTVQRTTDGGNTWSTQNLNESLNDIVFTSSNNGIIVGSGGHLFRTFDGGVLWTTQQIGTANQLNHVYFTNADNGIIVGGYGEILKTLDGGINWEQKSKGTKSSLFDVSLINENKCIVVGASFGEGGIILRTTNAGIIWNEQLFNNGFSSVSFADLNNGIALSGEKIFKTTDGGLTWTEKQSGTNNGLLDVDFIDLNNCFIVGQYGTILFSSDSGENWVLQSSGTSSNLHGVSFIDSMIGFIVGESSTVLKTTNGGNIWYSVSSGIWTDLAISFIDEDNGFVVGYYGRILKTTDGGLTWVSQQSGVSAYLTSVTYLDINNAYAVGYSGTIIRTTNGGDLWSIQSSGTSNYLYGVSFYDLDNGTAVGLGGTILHTTNGGITFIDENINSIQPQNFLLKQNYPNPFNPTTTITYQIPQTNFVTLKVYDILGREVATLVNEEKPAGSYEMQFEGGGLTSGIYFYQLKVGNPYTSSGQGYSETKKMILLK